MSEQTQEPVVLTEKRGRLGVITLNRPKAVNALNAPMVDAVTEALKEWRDDNDVAQVLVRGAGDRGLCAGGDVVALYHDMVDDGADPGSRDVSESEQFWAREYEMNALIDEYPKPYIAFMDGLVLGGGIGISAHGSHRLVTERTRSGMPETTIGFAPDVGGTWLLANAPGQTGVHAALTGAHLDGADAVFLGMADHWVDSSELDAIAEALETESADDVVERFSQTVPDSSLQRAQTWIDDAYSQPDPVAIVERLQQIGEDGVDEAGKAAETILSKSPTAVSVALEQVRRAKTLTRLTEALDAEYRVGVRMLQSHDFAEGIRAQVVDKDRNPQWRPPTLDAVDADIIAGYVAPLGDDELGLSTAVAGETTDNS